MRILTVRQPYASCIIHRCKAVENRSRSTPYRGIVLILSSTKLFTDERAQEAAHRCFGNADYIDDREHYPRGGIIGVAELHDVVTEDPSWWFTGPFGYLLRKAKSIPFIRCDGYQQAVVEPSPSIKAKVQKHI